MTKREQHKDEFHLFRIRNNNGEWVGEDNAVYLSHIEAIFYICLLQKTAKVYLCNMVQATLFGAINMNMRKSLP